MTITVFVDTNIFYDFTSLDHIPWKEKIFPNSEKIIIVLVPVNIKELNDHKDSGRKPQLSERAGSTLRYLDKLLEKAGPANTVTIRSCTELLFEHRDAPVTPPLNRDLEDDRLISNILQFERENPEAEIVLLTGDVGLKMKARPFNIRWQTLPDEYRTPIPQDPREKKIRILEKQIEALQGNLPELSLTFDGGLNSYNLLIPNNISLSEAAGAIEKIRSQFPLILPPKTKNSSQKTNLKNTYPVTSSTFAALENISFTQDALNWALYGNMLSVTRREQYNTDLIKFYREWQSYLEDNLDKYNILQRIRQLNFHLHNRGGIPATDIDIYIRFNGEVLLSSKSHPNDFPPIPTPPDRPKPELLDERQSTLSPPPFSSPLTIYPHLRKTEEHNVSGPKIKNNEPNVVHYHIKRLKHGQNEKLNPIFITCKNEGTLSLEVLFLINASESPADSEGILNVSFCSED